MERIQIPESLGLEDFVLSSLGRKGLVSKLRKLSPRRVLKKIHKKISPVSMIRGKKKGRKGRAEAPEEEAVEPTTVPEAPVYDEGAPPSAPPPAYYPPPSYPSAPPAYAYPPEEGPPPQEAVPDVVPTPTGPQRGEEALPPEAEAAPEEAPPEEEPSEEAAPEEEPSEEAAPEEEAPEEAEPEEKETFPEPEEAPSEGESFPEPEASEAPQASEEDAFESPRGKMKESEPLLGRYRPNLSFLAQTQPAQPPAKAPTKALIPSPSTPPNGGIWPLVLLTAGVLTVGVVIYYLKGGMETSSEA